MPATFQQFLFLEIDKLPGTAQFHTSRRQLDQLSIDEIFNYYQIYLLANYRKMLRNTVPADLAREASRLKREYTPKILHYNMTTDVHKPSSHTFWELIDNPSPREELVGKLEALTQRFVAPWKKVINPRPLPAGVRTTTIRPLQPGYSVSCGIKGANTPGGAGTLGGFIRATSGIYILSNAHVLTFNPLQAVDNSPVTQPGLGDMADAEAVADVTHHSQIIPDGLNPLDMAIAKLRPGISASYIYEEIGPLAGMRNPCIGESLTLIGRTTRRVTAVVQNIDDTQQVSGRGLGAQRDVRFTGLTILKRARGLFTNLEGDSGGLWIGEDNFAVALNFSGGEDSEYAMAFPMTTVVRQFRTWLGDDRAGLIGIDNSTLALSE